MPSLEQRLQRAETLIRQLQGTELRYVGQTGQPAFQNSWVNFDAGSPPPAGVGRHAAFARRGGLVVLSGVIKTGASGTTAFTLPVGFRPASDMQFANFAGTTLGGVSITAATGAVAPANYIAGSNVSAFVFLDGIVFVPAD